MWEGEIRFKFLYYSVLVSITIMLVMYLLSSFFDYPGEPLSSYLIIISWGVAVISWALFLCEVTKQDEELHQVL